MRMWILGLAAFLSSTAAAARTPDTLRYPYTDGAVYRVRLVPGAPFVVDLPAGETARAIYCDRRYWSAESTEGSSRVVIRALGSTDIVGKKGFIHIETERAGGGGSGQSLRISLKVHAVPEDSEVPAALQIYFEGQAAGDAVRQQVKKAVDAELVYAQRHAEEVARAKYETWKQQTIASLRDDYEWGGDFRIARVVDNKLQTYITVPDGSDKAVIHYVDKAGKREVLNYELNNGTYVIQNKVLRPGEKFRLILGKEQAWISLRQ